MSKTIQEIAQISASWWADKVSNPKFDNGDNGSGMMAGMLASMSVKPTDDESRTKFIKVLSETIATRLEHEKRQIIIDVDYGPCRILSQAAEQSKISSNNFPWKTVMWVDENHVSVRYGYSGDEEVLYASKAHWQNHIKSSEEMIERYKNGSMLCWINNEKEKSERTTEGIADLEKRIAKYNLCLETVEEQEGGLQYESSQIPTSQQLPIPSQGQAKVLVDNPNNNCSNIFYCTVGSHSPCGMGDKSIHESGILRRREVEKWHTYQYIVAVH